MGIQLSKPIPPLGRTPTKAECKQFRVRGILATQSGAWKVSWHNDGDNPPKPCIRYFDKRSGDGAGWIFEATNLKTEAKDNEKTDYKSKYL